MGMGRGIRTVRGLIAILLSLFYSMQVDQILAEEISSEYLEAWSTVITTDLNSRLEVQLQSEQETRQELEESRALFDKTRKSKTKAEIMLAERTEGFTLQKIEKIQSKIGVLQAALNVVDQLKLAELNAHAARPLSRTVGAYFSDHNKTKDLPLNTLLKEGDRLVTDEHGFLEFISTDGSFIQVGPQSSIRLNSNGSTHSDYSLERGKLHGVFKCIKVTDQPCREFDVHTSDFTAKFRTTELVMEILESGEHRIIVLDGNVVLTPPLDGGGVRLTAGLMVETTAEGKLQGPFNMDLNWIKRWWE